MNILMTIAVCLAGSAVLQMVGFFCYSTYHKRKLLKSFAFSGLNEQMPGSSTRQASTAKEAMARSGGKVAALHPNNFIIAVSTNKSKSKSDSQLHKRVAQ
ncbi:MAG: hypothetical protein LH478_12370 [Chitinophagaceae bacterium]|nr:hypothetical protein [Chitinophagaceae bacterium]